MKTKLQHIGEQLLPVIAYGDAAGLPVETRSAEEIADLYGYVDSLLLTDDNPYFSGVYEPGMWSDDTQLSMAIIRGLIRAHDFSLEMIADEHVREYKDTPTVMRKGRLRRRGWGKGTEESIHRVMSGMSPYKSGSPISTGNGVIMKLAPLAYWQYAQGVEDRVRHDQYDQLTSMTHDTDIARICTRVHGDALCRTLDTGSVFELGDFVLSRALDHEEVFGGANTDTSDALSYLANSEPSREDILEKTDAKGFYVPQTLAMVYGNVIVNTGNFANVVYGAVNLGGDTDSIASVSGAIELFAQSEVALPDDAELLVNLSELQQLSRRFSLLAIN
ncbi:ADP-ribosylglycohydrolase family protein [Candidatus Saccharibacteria bacterium]|nr:ADP-ribosylglycohydrolase family protein [Candidatus Saccharibacteria bacterium]